MSPAPRRKFRPVRAWLVSALLLSATGCHHDPDPKVVAAMVKFFLASAAVDSQRKRAARAFQHFVNRRIFYLLGANSGWGSETPNYSSMSQRLTSELNEVISFLDGKLGTSDSPGPLGGGTDSGPILHLDLADAARLFATDQFGDDAVTTRMSDYLDRRRTAVESIVWRAAALHHELWSGPDSATTTTLNQKAIALILDRRLRVYERMHVQDDGLAPDTRAWTTTSATSGWKDGLRAVIVEYPFINLAKDGSDPFSQAIASAGLSLDNVPGFDHVTDPETELRYQSSVRFPPAVAGSWVQRSSAPYLVDLKAGLQPSTVLDQTLPSTSPLPDYTDFWSRPWMFCDHMAALLHVEALRFGLVRRNGDADAEFNGAAAQGVHLVPLLNGLTGMGPATRIMDAGDKYFEASAIAPGDLQVGDHVIFWNNYLMRAMFRSDFGLENSIVADAAGEGTSDALQFVGHGMRLSTYADFAKSMYDGLNDLFGKMRAVASTIPSSVFYRPFPKFRLALIEWAPFGETFVGPGGTTPARPWWVRIQLKDTTVFGGDPLSLADALTAFPRSIAIDVKREQPPPSNTPDHASDWKESIYVPLYVPNGIKGGWEAYLENADPETAGLATVILDETKADASFIPGLYFKGASSKIAVVRPKVIV